MDFTPNFAEQLLARMSDAERQRYVRTYGAEVFAQLWREAHRHTPGGPPPLPDDLDLGGRFMRRDEFDELSPAEAAAFIRSGGQVAD